MKKTTKNGEVGTLINIPVFIPDGELDSILCACFEGGSNYWIKSVSVDGDDYRGKEFASEVPGAGGYLTITESCDGSKPVKHELSKPKLLNGIYLYFCKEGVITFDDLDAPASDMILQYALFSEVKYG